MNSPLNPGPELTIPCAAVLRTAWLAALAEHPANGSPFAVDLGAVQEIDSAGVQLLLALGHSLAQRQQSLHIVAASPAAREALGVYGLQGLLQAPAAA